MKQNMARLKLCFETPKFELFMVMLCTPGSDRNSCYGGQSLHQSNDSFILLPSCRASWCLDRFQVTSDPLSDDLGAQPTANRTGWVSTEDLQRPNQSNCLKGLTEIDTAKWVAPTNSSRCALGQVAI
jgi:hypothetical protein